MYKESKCFAVNARLLCSFRQLFVTFTDFQAHLETFLLLLSKLMHFMSMSGDGKICLCESNLRFARIAIHRDEVTGVLAQVVVLDTLDRTFPASDTFTGISKVILDATS